MGGEKGTDVFFYEKYIWLYSDFEKMVFVFYEIWQFLCFFYLIYFVFHDCDDFYVFFFFMMLCWFFIFCFSFLNNWLENIERTITLQCFFISNTWRTANKQQRFLFHTHGEHWTNIDFAFIYYLNLFWRCFRIGGFLTTGERKTNWTANFADISNCTNCCMMAGSEVSVMTYEQKNKLCGVCVCVGGGAGRCQCWG